MNQLKYGLAPTLLLTATSLSAQTLRWQGNPSRLEQPVASTIPPGLAATSPGGFLRAADLDNDGDLDFMVNQDVVVNGRNLPLNPPLGVVTSGLLPPAGLRTVFLNPFHDADAADLDGDGDLDFVAVGEFAPGSGAIEIRRNATGTAAGSTILFNNPNGPPAGAQWNAPLSAPVGIRAVELFDVDQDGDNDIVLGTAGGLFVWFNEPHPTNPPPARAFTNQVLVDPPAAADPVQVLASGDLDGDGITDLIRGGDLPGSFVVQLGTGLAAAPFVAGPPLPLLEPSLPSSASIADVDADGFQDILVGYRAIGNPGLTAFIGGGVQVYTGIPAGGFALFQTFGNTVADRISPRAIIAPDLHADGAVELVIAAHEEEFTPASGPPNLTIDGGTRVWERAIAPVPFADASATWIDDDSTAPTGNPARCVDVVAADYDSDGDLDILSSYAGAAEPGVFTNLVGQLDAPLAVPAGAGVLTYTLFCDIDRPVLNLAPGVAALGVTLGAPQYGPPLAGILGLPTTPVAPDAWVTATVSPPAGSNGVWTATFDLPLPPTFNAPAFAQAFLINSNILPAGRISFTSMQRTWVF